MKKTLILVLAFAIGYAAPSFAANLLELRDSSNVTQMNITDAATPIIEQADLAGNADTATALAANGANCSANQFNKGVDASGAAESCAALVDADVPNTITVDNAATADALSADPADCADGFYALGVDASGVAVCSAVATSAVSASTAAVSSGALFTHDADAAAHHTATVNTNADTICTGTGNYLDGEGNCDALVTGHSDGANCSAGTFPLGVDASGAVQSCSTALSGNADTATALAADPADCADGFYSLGINASGVAVCSAVDDTDGGVNASTAAVSSNVLFDHEAKASVHHTATVDTSADTICVGTDVYLDGEGNCDTITSSNNGGTATTASICGSTPATGGGDFKISTDDFDLYTATGTLIGQWRNSRTGVGPC